MSNVVKHPKTPIDHTSGAAAKPMLLDQARDQVRLKHYSIRTETQYVQWIRRFILFHGKRQPRNMGNYSFLKLASGRPAALISAICYEVKSLPKSSARLWPFTLVGPDLRMISVFSPSSTANASQTIAGAAKNST
ncbi:MAG: phage integrase N-terminal SAM-like domain-containing protein [Porticoccaceae bacterium]